VIKALNKAGLDACSVENPACPGTPDVQHMFGWLELKWKEKWPAKEDTALRLPHFTPQQRCWLMRRYVAQQKLGCHTGHAFLLLYVEETREHLLFNGRRAAKDVGKDGATREKLYEWALVRSKDLQDIINYVDLS
jgi:hypothetical protein